MVISIEINGRKKTVAVESMRRLLDWLRNDEYLTGTKEGCGEGECGACTVLLNGEPVNACLLLMGQLDGARIQTIEGIRNDPDGKKLIDAFCELGAVQCGFCTPGFILAAYPLLKSRQPITEDAIKRAIAGNLCRCTGYSKIIDAIKTALGVAHE